MQIAPEGERARAPASTGYRNNRRVPYLRFDESEGPDHAGACRTSMINLSDMAALICCVVYLAAPAAKVSQPQGVSRESESESASTPRAIKVTFMLRTRYLSCEQWQ